METLKLDADYNITYNKATLDDPMCKGYVYANIYFYDEVQKEVKKLGSMVEKFYREVTTDLGITNADPTKLLADISARASRTIGDDGLDMLIKEFLAQKSQHISLMVDARERMKFAQICEAIFMELTAAFYQATIQSATDLEGGVKTFKFSPEYIAAMTERQKVLVTPALRMIGLENNVRLQDLRIAKDFTVRYMPELYTQSHAKQEETMKDQIKTFIQTHSEE